MAAQIEESLGELRVELNQLREHVDLLLIELASHRPLASEVPELRQRLAACEVELSQLRGVRLELDALKGRVAELERRSETRTSRAWPAVALLSWAFFANLTAVLLALLASASTVCAK